MGVYRLRPAVVAFRNDVCLTCGIARRSLQVRTFNILDLHGVPLIPVGFWKRWLCTSCGSRPEYNPQSRRKFALTLAALAAAFGAIFWGLPVEPDQAATWLLIRYLSPVVLVAALVWSVVAEGTPSTTERLSGVAVSRETTCPFCEIGLSPTEWRCPSCRIQRK
jgi:hypothetical protein